MNTATESTDRNGIGSTLWCVAIVGGLFCAAAPTLLGPATRLSVALGSLLALGNLWAISRTVRGFLHPAGARSPWISLAMLKFAVMFLGVLFLVRAGYAKLLPLVVGYAAMPIGIVISQLKSTTASSGEG